MAVSLKRCRWRSSAAADIAGHDASPVNKRERHPASEAEEPGSANKPSHPSVTTSGVPSTCVATTGVPAASDSRTTIGMPSP